MRIAGVSASPGGARVLRRVDLDVPPGGRLALVGPSGAGKTTLLRVIAGLEPADEGRIEADGMSLAGLPPHRRPIAMVFQEPRLFPGLDVAENVAFGLRAAGVGRRVRRGRAKALLDEVGMGGLADRAVGGLSGGEQQRIALARALCAEPRLLLLDEPTASVDPDRREALRDLILRLQAERRITTIIVTHDRQEAAQIGERIALMIEGRIIQCDAPRELFLRPASAAAARFLGTRNILAGDVRGGALATEAGPVAVTGPDGPARVSVRPEEIRLDDAGPLRMTVREATFLGSHVRVRLGRGSMRLEAHVPPGAGPAVGAEVGVRVVEVWRLPGEDPAAVAEPGDVTRA